MVITIYSWHKDADVALPKDVHTNFRSTERQSAAVWKKIGDLN